MTSTAGQQSQGKGRRRKNKRSRDPAVAATVVQTTRMRRECQNALVALARLEQEQRLEDIALLELEHTQQALWEALANIEIEMLAAEDLGDVVEDGVDDGGPARVPEATYTIVAGPRAERKRCARCHKFLPQKAVPEVSSLNGGSVCNTVSDVSVLGADDQEIADDGASS